MEFIGKVIQILPKQGGTSAASGKNWSLETFIAETQEQYPRKVAVEVFGEERISNNPVEVDQLYTISFDLESREFNGRWYTSVRAWKVEPVQNAASEATNNPGRPVTPPVMFPTVSGAPVTPGGDLPY